MATTQPYMYNLLVSMQYTRQDFDNGAVEDFTVETNCVPRIGESFHYTFGEGGWLERTVTDISYCFQHSQCARKDGRIDVLVFLDTEFNDLVDETATADFEGNKIKKRSIPAYINQVLKDQKEQAG